MNFRGKCLEEMLRGKENCLVNLCFKSKKIKFNDREKCLKLFFIDSKLRRNGEIV